MSTDEYVPSGDDERIAHAYAEVVHLGSEGMVSHDEAVGEFYAYLAAHDARVRRDAADEAWTDCVSEASALGWLHPSAALDMLNRNPHEETP